MEGSKNNPKKAVPYCFKDGKWYATMLVERPKTPQPSLDVYSSNRTEVGTWIDGRKIYRKVYSGRGDVPLEVTVDRCATVIDMRMVVKTKQIMGLGEPCLGYMIRQTIAGLRGFI